MAAGGAYRRLLLSLQPILQSKSTHVKFNYVAMQILVFKTNLNNQHRITDAADRLDVHPEIIEWNVDAQDCDHVLRVVGKQINANEIETLLLSAGFYCEELL